MKTKKKTYVAPKIEAIVPIPDALMAGLPLNGSTVNKGEVKRRDNSFDDDDVTGCWTKTMPDMENEIC